MAQSQGMMTGRDSRAKSKHRLIVARASPTCKTWDDAPADAGRLLTTPVSLLQGTHGSISTVPSCCSIVFQTCEEMPSPSLQVSNACVKCKVSFGV